MAKHNFQLLVAYWPAYWIFEKKYKDINFEALF